MLFLLFNLRINLAYLISVLWC